MAAFRTKQKAAIRFEKPYQIDAGMQNPRAAPGWVYGTVTVHESPDPGLPSSSHTRTLLLANVMGTERFTGELP